MNEKEFEHLSKRGMSERNKVQSQMICRMRAALLLLKEGSELADKSGCDVTAGYVEEVCDKGLDMRF